jgi:hypothetical protein
MGSIARGIFILIWKVLGSHLSLHIGYAELIIFLSILADKYKDITIIRPLKCPSSHFQIIIYLSTRRYIV